MHADPAGESRRASERDDAEPRERRAGIRAVRRGRDGRRARSWAGGDANQRRPSSAKRAPGYRASSKSLRCNSLLLTCGTRAAASASSQHFVRRDPPADPMSSAIEETTLPGDLPGVKLTSPKGTAEVYRHGAHVTSWKTETGEELISLSTDVRARSNAPPPPLPPTSGRRAIPRRLFAPPRSHQTHPPLPPRLPAPFRAHQVMFKPPSDPRRSPSASRSSAILAPSARRPARAMGRRRPDSTP